MPVDEARRRIVPRGDEVEVLAPLLLEASELDQLVAHHVGVGRQPSAHRVDGVLDDLRPILLVEGDDLERAVIPMRQMAYDL